MIRHEDQAAGGVVGSTLIEVNGVYARVSTVKAGDLVRTHRGEGVVSDVRMNTSAQLQRTEITGLPLIMSSRDRRFLARRADHDTNAKRLAPAGPADWVPASELTRDHYVALPIDPVGPQEGPMDPDWFLLGLFCGGLHSPFTVNSIEPNELPHSFLRDLDEQLIHLGIIEERLFQGLWEILSEDVQKRIVRLFRGLNSKEDPERAAGFRPDVLMRAPRDVQAALWAGLSASPIGQETPYGRQHRMGHIALTHERAARAMSRIGRNVKGRHLVLHKHEQNDLTYFSRQDFSVRFLPDDDLLTFKDAGMMWVRVQDSETLGTFAPVYDLIIEGDGSFVAGGAMIGDGTKSEVN